MARDGANRGNRCEVAADALDETGYGVGSNGDERVHVADLLPGERAEVAIDHRSRHAPTAWGRVVRRLGAPSPHRVDPPCPAFGRCGGCTWQHLDYPAQLIAKRDRVIAALGRTDVAAVRPSPDVIGYRNKGKYVVGRNAGHLVFGAYAPRTHTVVDTLGCKVVAPIIDEVASWVRGAAESAELVAYDEATRTGELRYVIVREVGGDVLIALIIASATPRAKLEQVANAMARHPAVRGLVAIDNDRRDGAIVPSGSPAAKILFGHGYLVDDLAGAEIEIGVGEFAQINRVQARALYARVVELAELAPGDAAVDLYAGLGGIGLHLARAGARVIAVEHDGDAVAALRRAAERASLPVTAIAADAAALPVA
ncbi:MAG TPA: 23S rRNA (uracil(1939)-C(5))-methyltransferase RlmD, partial [Kofleriaceae bacterium]|nr:23S rRNA (uracil(1939)-C(5))-methyltransferase RlmD [Kofleriaceae bacterium]